MRRRSRSGDRGEHEWHLRQPLLRNRGTRPCRRSLWIRMCRPGRVGQALLRCSRKTLARRPTMGRRCYLPRRRGTASPAGTGTCRGAAREPGSVPSSGALRPSLREYEGGSNEVGAALESEEARREFVRELWSGATASRPSHRSEPREQRGGEPEDVLRELSPQAPLAGGSGQACGCGAFRWGPYEAAIHRWEAVLGRHAPIPVDDRGRLDPEFVTFMMGFPSGWTEGMSPHPSPQSVGECCGSPAGVRRLAGVDGGNLPSSFSGSSRYLFQRHLRRTRNE